MFKKAQVSILILALVAFVYVESSGLHRRQYGHKKHPTLDDHCFYEDHNVTVKLHETVRPINIPYKCLEISCDDEYLLTIQGCPASANSCPNGFDISKPYPECCDCH